MNEKPIILSVHLLFLVLFTLILAECPAVAALDVVTTTTDLQALVKAVGGDRVRVSSIGKGHEDPHFVEPKPSYMMTLGRARMLFCIGLELEIWLKPLLEGSRNLEIMPGNHGYVDCSQAVEVKEIPTTRVDPSMGDVHPLGNPHYWLDPANGIKIAEFIAAKLAEGDPSGADLFRKNAAEFRADIERRLPAWKDRLTGFPNRSVACFHSSWVYFADAFGLKIIGYVEPRPGVPPTGREMAALVMRMKANNVKIILREQYHSYRFANLAADKVQGKVLLMPSSVGSEPAIKGYAELIEAMVARVAEGLALQQ